MSWQSDDAAGPRCKPWTPPASPMGGANPPWPSTAPPRPAGRARPSGWRAIRDMGLEMQVIFNKGAVMVLPSGINKATGLQAAAAEMGLSPHDVVGVGDAENDHSFLELCGYAVAV